MTTPVLTKDRTLISFSTIPGEWETCSDPQVSREVAKYRRSPGGPQEAVGGRATYDNVTLVRFWDSARDGAILRQWKANQNLYDGGTLSLTDTGPDGLATGAPDTYVGVVESMSRTGADANSADQSKLTVVLSISSGA